MTRPSFASAALPLAVFAALLSVTQVSAAPREYYATDLGDLPGGSDRTRGYALNNLGQVVGGSRTTSINPSANPTGVEHPFLWTPTVPNGATGSMLDLGIGVPVTGNLLASARGINDAGQVVGDRWDANAEEVFLWNPTTANGTSGTMTTILPATTMYGGWGALGLNANGQVVGIKDPGSLPSHAFIWSPDTPGAATGQVTDLGDLPGGYDRATGNAVNEGGQVAGGGDTGGPGGRAFLWNPSAPNGSSGAMVELSFPGGYDAMAANGINDAGQVVGYVRTSTGPDAFVWTPDAPNASAGTTVVLPKFGPGFSTEANDINNLGEVVGRLVGGGAFVWTEGDGMHALTDLLAAPLPADWTLTEAVAVNDVGQVLVSAIYQPSVDLKPIEHAFLLTPVPEPAGAAAAMVLAAGASLRGRRRRA